MMYVPFFFSMSPFLFGMIAGQADELLKEMKALIEQLKVERGNSRKSQTR